MYSRLTCITICILFSGYSLKAISNTIPQKARSVSYTYNEQGLISKVDGPRTDLNDITSYLYDSQGRVVKKINALGHTVEVLSYNNFGKPLSIKNENGVVTSLNYNGFGWLTSITTLHKTTSFEHNELGDITKVILPDNSHLGYEYNSNQQLIAIEDNDGNRVEYYLDSAGNNVKTEIKNNKNVITSKHQSVFDELSRVRSTIGGTGATVYYDYNKNGLLTSRKDSLSNNTAHSYDALSRHTKTVDAEQGVTKFTYDSANRIENVVDAENKDTTYTYNSFDERSKRSSHDTGNTNYAYDEAGNLISKTDARGINIQYEYDALSRLTLIKYADTVENVVFTYDDTSDQNKGVGKLTKVVGETGQITFNYDEYGQLVKEAYQLNKSDKEQDGSQSYQISYNYNNNGVINEIIYPSGRKISFSFNSLGKVNGIQSKSSTDTSYSTVLKDVEYLPFGPANSFTYGNNLKANKYFDLDYRVIGGKLSNFTDQTLNYSTIGNIESISDSVNPTENQTLEYDKLSRLISATGEYGALEFGYDKIGNRTSKKKDGYLDTYLYQNNNHHLTKVDENITNTTSSYAYRFNQSGRLEQLTSNGLVTSYKYNYRGLRTAKYSDNDKTHYHYDSNGQLIAESSVDGEWKKEYVYFEQKLVAIIDYAHDSGGKLYFVYSDYLGTPRLATNTEGALVWKAKYSPFGNATINNDPDNDGKILNINHRFLGQYFDAESKLHYNWNRYYDPALGKYISPDPIGIYDGVNIYEYASSNPFSYTDPWGLSKKTGNIGDSGLAHLSDSEISRRARDKSLPKKERRRYQTEEKFRGHRDREKRRNNKGKLRGGPLGVWDLLQLQCQMGIVPGNIGCLRENIPKNKTCNMV